MPGEFRPAKQNSQKTVFNLITAIVVILGLFSVGSARWTFISLGITSVMSACSVIDGGSNTVLPYYVISVVAGINLVSEVVVKKRRAALDLLLEAKWLIAGILILVLGSGILPLVFEGVPVYSARVGIDEQVVQKSLLAPSVSNLAQSIYLTLNLGVALYAGVAMIPSRVEIDARKRFQPNWTATRVAVLASMVCGLFWCIYQILSIRTNLYFPAAIHNASYSVLSNDHALAVRRINGSFTEPSYAAQFASAMVALGLGFIIFKRRKISGALVALAGIALVILIGSTTGILSIAAAFILLIWFAGRVGRSAAVLVTSIGMSVGVAVVSFPFWEILVDRFNDYIIYKNETLSFVNRLASVVDSLEIVSATYGLGVGIGSHRPSSMLVMFVTSSGVFSVFILLHLYKIIAVSVKSGMQGWPGILVLIFCTILFGQATVIPDASNPIWALYWALSTGYYLFLLNAASGMQQSRSE